MPKKTVTEVFVEPIQRTFDELPWFEPTIQIVFIGSIINVLTNTLSAWGGLYGMLFIVLLFVIAALIVIINNVRHFQWVHSLGPIVDKIAPGQHEGLIFIFSNPDILRKAISYHSPVLKYVWLLLTPDNLVAAATIMAEFPHLKYEPKEIPELYDASACYKTVQKIYQTSSLLYQISPEKIISDITGGTKPMSMGMIVACIEGDFPIEHTPTMFDKMKKPTGALPPIEIRLR